MSNCESRCWRSLASAVVALVVAAPVMAAPASLGNVTDARVLAESPTGNNWLVKGGSFKQQQFSPLKQITDKNVGTLGLAWATEIDSPMGLASEPIVVDGVVYLSAPRSIVYAIGASSGAVIWRFDPKVRLDMSADSSYAARVNRGVAVWNGKVYVATGDCRLVAIDAAKGTSLWDSTICDPHQTGSTDAPRVADGKVYVGYNGSDDEVRGSVVAFDADTGKEVWRFWTVPSDPAKGFESKALAMAAKTWSGKEWWWHGGGDVWNAITFDPDTGLLLFATSTAHRGEGTTKRKTSGGKKLFSGCIVAVNADTGEYAWHFQTSTPKWQQENFHILLADLVIRGQKRHVAMTVPRRGSFYVLDAKTGKLLSQKPLVEHSAADSAEPAGASAPASGYEQSVEGCADCPGVHNWWPMSFSPITELVYVPIIDRRKGTPQPGQIEYVGRLIAWNPRTEAVQWTQEHPIAINSGVLSTAGNLVFQGEGTGEFAGYAADSGKKLWRIHTGSAINAVPVSYSVDGEQYILVPVGWGSASRLFFPASMMVTEETKRGPSRLLAFKLGARTPFPYPKIVISPVPQPPKQSFSREAIQRGAWLAETHMCTGCHSPEFDGSGAWTLNGAIPDLRYMPEEAHRDWYGIVLGGSHRPQGMMGFGVQQWFPEMDALTASDADDIHAYVIEKSWEAYNAQRRGLVVPVRRSFQLTH
jgi:quinohemoprotein ethanol dehydrogenase